MLFAPTAIPPGLTAEQFNDQVVRKRIDDHGVAVLAHNRVVIFYSGPSAEIVKKLFGRRKNIRANWKRAAEQATRHKASRINDTDLSEYLESVKLETYFYPTYKGETKAIDEAILKVWGCASEEFAGLDFEEAVTFVCAADLKKVFRRFEQSSLLKNKHLKIINARPAEMFRQFQAINTYEAFRLICITELLEARKYAQQKGTKKAWHDYRMRRKFFLADRSDMLPVLSAMPDAEKAEIKQRKRDVLAAFRHIKPRRMPIITMGKRPRHRKLASPKAA